MMTKRTIHFDFDAVEGLMIGAAFSLLMAALIIASCSIAANAADIIDYRNSVEGYDHYIRITGRLKTGDEVVFRTIALEIPLSHRVEVSLTSPGGSLEGLLEIGKIIRQRGWSTIATGTCNSACAFIWLAGYKRMTYPGAVLGFHQAGEDCASGTCQRVSGLGNALLGAYLNELGFDDKAIRLFTKAPPAEFTWISSAILSQYGVSCEIVGAHQVGPR
jgi:hypothetical protein